MSDHSNSQSPTRAVVQNYGLALGLAVFMGVLSYGSGDALSLAVLKGLLSPFYLLAVRGLATFFHEPIIEPFWSARSVEYTLLNAAVFAVFMALMLWRPDQQINAMLTQLGLNFSIFGAFMLFGLGLRIRGLQKGARSPD
jgi:hypothetical protein